MLRLYYMGMGKKKETRTERRPAGMQIIRQTFRPTHVDVQTDRQVNRCVYGYLDGNKQADRMMCGGLGKGTEIDRTQSDIRQAGRQAGRVTDVWIDKPTD